MNITTTVIYSDHPQYLQLLAFHLYMDYGFILRVWFVHVCTQSLRGYMYIMIRAQRVFVSLIYTDLQQINLSKLVPPRYLSVAL